MINEGGLASMNDTCLAEDSVSDISVQNGKVSIICIFSKTSSQISEAYLEKIDSSP